jgi:hypothetical protein
MIRSYCVICDTLMSEHSFTESKCFHANYAWLDIKFPIREGTLRVSIHAKFENSNGRTIEEAVYLCSGCMASILESEVNRIKTTPK